MKNKTQPILPQENTICQKNNHQQSIDACENALPLQGVQLPRRGW